MMRKVKVFVASAACLATLFVFSLFIPERSVTILDILSSNSTQGRLLAPRGLTNAGLSQKEIEHRIALIDFQIEEETSKIEEAEHVIQDGVSYLHSLASSKLESKIARDRAKFLVWKQKAEAAQAKAHKLSALAVKELNFSNTYDFEVARC